MQNELLSGDQFSSLTTITQQVKPEKFNNYEAGLKWDVRSQLSLTTAAFRLNRENTRSTDPNDPTRIVQTGSTRTNGFEVWINGSLTRVWSVARGYAYQDAFIRSTTTSGPGARLSARAWCGIDGSILIYSSDYYSAGPKPPIAGPLTTLPDESNREP